MRQGDTADVARGLGHPLRLRILHEYRRGATSPSRIARRLDLPLHLVAYHTNALKRIGAIEQTRIERRRGVIERFHHAVTVPPIGLPGWEGVPVKVRRRLLRAVLGLLMEDVERAAAAGGFDGDDARLSRRPVQLDGPGLQGLAALLRRLDDDVAALEAASAARGGECAARELALLCFEDRPGAR